MVVMDGEEDIEVDRPTVDLRECVALDSEMKMEAETEAESTWLLRSCTNAASRQASLHWSP